MTERWSKMVENERLAATVGVPPTKVLRCDDAVKLLARQHRRMVRLVKMVQRGGLLHNKRMPLAGACLATYREACDDLLAALAKQGARKKG